MASTILSASVYVSHAGVALSDTILRVAAAAAPGVALGWHHRDTVYGRSTFTLVGDAPSLPSAAAEVAGAALEAIDMTSHRGSHPTLGAVDHVAFHPLSAQDNLPVAAMAAKEFGSRLTRDRGVPVHYYGEASLTRRRLADLRRELGYFEAESRCHHPGSAYVWPPAETPRPDLASGAEDQPGLARSGLCLVGAVPFMTNLNVRLATSDRAVAAGVTRAVRERDGGLKGVEAVTLAHEGGQYEVACNLRCPEVTGPEVLEEAIRAESMARGVAVVECYTLGETRGNLLKAHAAAAE